ncbi:protein ALTERED PHOSPHATE STARVATION RESPONSE 1-like [Prosopis cineraria]|uniref:protein ALTERED PHOSPHATE STARVATION RESPONSE 1-like n=1 Tax=Prosopis cineraria TaxID=364024 RepID=UPI00240F4DA1|nr:protein ALTERED PHOSPHATE STARVATION RESPONSE 1-like [Prosopis cineraria]
MGCSQSRLDDEEAVQLCKQRKEFIKQAVEQRTRFASGHIAYTHSLQKVSAALRDYIEEDHEPHEFLDSFKKTFMPNMTVGFVPSSVAMKVNYLRASGNPVISVQERIQSPEIVQVEAYSPINRFGIDGFLAMNSSFFPYHSPNNRPNLPSLSPQASQWDFYWNPFSSLDYHGYPTRSNLDQVAINNEARGEEEIPDLEEDETEPDKFTGKRYLAEERTNFGINSSMGATVVEEDYDNNDDNDEMECPEEGCGSGNLDAPKALTTGHVKPRHKIMAIDDQDGDEETPGFPVYVDRRPTSMAEVIRDLESQFHSACNAANDASELLQGNFLNPVAIFRSASSPSPSPLARVLLNSSSTRDRDKGYDSSDNLPEDPSMLSDSSHQSTLERLYEWEKKLYKEVRSGERVRIVYEKNCTLFRDQDVKGEDPSAVDRTRVTIRDLHAQMMVSMRSIDVISQRIETLRDEELHPQLLQLVKGLARMWKVMAECHWTQKRILEEAMILLPRMQLSISSPGPHRPARSTSSLESELKNWRARFESWIAAQRSYVHALTGWLQWCVRSNAPVDASPRRSCSGTHPLIGLCAEWSRRLDEIHEASVLEGIDYFTAGVRSLSAQEVRENSLRNGGGWKKSDGNIGEVEAEGEVVIAEKMREDEIMMICGGIAVAMSSLAEFAVDSSKVYDQLVELWGHAKCKDASPVDLAAT